MVVSLVAPVGATPSADAPLPASAPPPSVMGLFVYPDSHAAREQRDWLAAGRVDDAELVARIADQPTPAWLTDPTDVVGNDVRTSVRRAAAAGLGLRRFLRRRCRRPGGLSGLDPAVAGALHDTSATIILEPDALAHELAGCESSQ